MPREKTVHRDPYHVWANNPDKIGRNASNNRSFREGFAYSYNEPIARILDVNGTRVALVRDRTFSVTTSKHQSEVRQAIFHISPRFTVRHIGGRSSWENGYGENVRNDTDIDHVQNVEHFTAKIEAQAITARRSRSRVEWEVRQLDSLVAAANAYAEFFNLSARFITPALPDIDAKIKAQRAAVAERTKREAEQMKLRRAADAVQFQQWLNGMTTVNFPDSYRRYTTGTDYLRVIGGNDEDGGYNVQTSQRAIVPIKFVRRAMPLVLRVLDRGETWTAPPEKSIHLGNYQLTEISPDGVRVGCHLFTPAEVRRFAAVLDSFTADLQATPASI